MNELSEQENLKETSVLSKSAVDRCVMLPCPRLEFRWIKTGDNWRDRECIYSLVIPLGELDIRHTDDIDNPTEKFLEIGRTKVQGGNGNPPIRNREVETPFRDYSHAIWDRKSLGNYLPIVSICEKTWSLVKLQPE